MRVVKGHGTGNDFVVVPDPDGELDLAPDLVAALCDRRRGIGGDGVLRVVRTAAAGVEAPTDVEWFMDYRNADGSIAEMCGNGVRVYSRYLVAEGLVEPGPLLLATRGGVRAVEVPATGDVTVDMGPARLGGEVRVTIGERSWPARTVDLGNPHAVALVRDLAHAGDLRDPPQVEPASAVPDGVNVELVVVDRPGSLAMRVHERGVGETQSCGTGACAAAAVARAAHPGSDRWEVRVPGGRLEVVARDDGHLVMTGPAELVATIDLAPSWLAAHGG